MSKKNILKVLFILITFLLFGPIRIAAQSNIKKSPALESLLEHIEKNYIPPQWNVGIDEIAKSTPDLYCIFLGSAMRKQEDYLNQYPENSENFKILNDEIISLIPKIADAYNNANYNNSDYLYIDDITLGGTYYDALNGDLDEGFKQGYKNGSGKDIAQVNMPFILDPVEPNYIKEAKKEKGIVLLGVKADEVKSPPSPEYTTRSFPEDIIVGTWTNTYGESVIFKKIKDVYEGIIETQEEYNDGWVGYERKTSIRRVIMIYKMRHSWFAADSPDPKNPGWFVNFSRHYKGQLSFTYIPHRTRSRGPIQESSFYIYWNDKDKRFALVTDLSSYYRK